MLKRYTIIGSIAAGLSVAIGAFGAHVLKDILTTERLATFETGVQYHMIHALALILIAILADRLQDKKKVQWAARFILAGIIIFSGSLYLLCLTDITMLGAITPIGGVAFIVGWIMLALAAKQSAK